MTMAEEKSGSTLSAEAEEFKVSKKIKPAQPTPEVEEEVEEEVRSDLSSKIGYTDEEYILYGSSFADVKVETKLYKYLKNMNIVYHISTGSNSVDAGAGNDLVLDAIEENADLPGSPTE